MARLLALFAAVLVLAGCERQSADETAAPPADAGVVNLYTSRHYDADLQLYDAFTEATGIRVNRLEMAPDQLIERMRAEGQASPADVILMADAGALWRAEQAGLFQPVDSQVLEEKIPAQLRDPEDRWFGFSRRARVIAYDRNKVQPEEVATYEALASPRFRNQVCVRSSENVYNLSLMAALIERWGREKALQWARGVVANMARTPQGGDVDQIRAIGAGVCQVALTNSYYYLRLARSDNPQDEQLVSVAALSFPNQAREGVHVNISGGGVAANAPNREAAVRFLEFLATDEAQAIFAGANNEFPAVPDAPTPEALQPYETFKADPISVAVFGRRQAEAQAVFDEAGWR